MPEVVADPPVQRTRLVVLTVSAGVFMANLDLFIVNLALPSIGQDLGGAGLARLSWVLTAYAAVFAGFLVPLGRWADRVGRRRGYVIGLVVFTAASALAAAAPTVDLLIAARALQALGAALVVPTSLSLLLAAVPPAGRAVAIGGWAAASAVAAASGPVLGGLLVEAGWYWVFLVNVPIGITTVVLALRFLPESHHAGAGRPDLLGAAALTGGTALLALGLVEGGSWGWTSASTLGALVGALALTGVVVHRSRTHPEPVVAPALVRPPAFRAANLASLLYLRRLRRDAAVAGAAHGGRVGLPAAPDRPRHRPRTAGRPRRRPPADPPAAGGPRRAGHRRRRRPCCSPPASRSGS